MKLRIALAGYSLLWWLLLPVILLRLWVRGFKLPTYRKRWRERLGFWPNIPKNCLWVHAVSVGETMAARELIENWLKDHPDIPVLVTTMTPTGSDTVRQLFGDRVHHAYLAWDIRSIQRRLIERLEPRILVIMETELWPNLIDACHRKNVPIVLANARLSERSKNGYQRVRWISKPMLQKITGIAGNRFLSAQTIAHWLKR